MNGTDYERGFNRARQEQQDIQSVKDELLDHIGETNKRINEMDRKLTLYMIGFLFIALGTNPTVLDTVVKLFFVIHP